MGSGTAHPMVGFRRPAKARRKVAHELRPRAQTGNGAHDLITPQPRLRRPPRSSATFSSWS